MLTPQAKGLVQIKTLISISDHAEAEVVVLGRKEFLLEAPGRECGLARERSSRKTIRKQKHVEQCAAARRDADAAVLRDQLMPGRSAAPRAAALVDNS
jgi:hypothetical protein